MILFLIVCIDVIINLKIIAHYFLSEFFRFLANVTDYVVFTVGSFVIRGLEALGASAFSTSSFVFVVELYPDNVSTVLVCIYLFNYLRYFDFIFP